MSDRNYRNIEIDLSSNYYNENSEEAGNVLEDEYCYKVSHKESLNTKLEFNKIFTLFKAHKFVCFFLLIFIFGVKPIKAVNKDDVSLDIEQKIQLEDKVKISFLTSNLRSNSNNLLEFRNNLLEMSEKTLIEAFDKIYDYNKDNFNSKSKEDSFYMDLETLIFLKISIDKDYSDLFKAILNKKFKLFYWKINYLPVVFYVADNNKQKCLDVLLEQYPITKTELSYRKGRVLEVYESKLRKDGELLYSFRRLSTSDNFFRWGEIILNLDNKVFEKIDDDKIENELDIGKTLLHSAAQNGNISLAKKLITSGISLNKETKKGYTPLYYAVKNNHYQMVEFLIKQGAKVDEKFKNMTSDSRMFKILGLT